MDEVDLFLDRCVAQLRRCRGEPIATHESSIEAIREATEDRSKRWIDRWFAKWALRQLERQSANAAFASDLSPILASEVVAHRFTETQFRDGYDTAEVDEVLDRMVAVLEDHERDEAASA